MPQSIVDNFSKTGVSHIIAVSGYNITIMIYALASLALFVWAARELLAGHCDHCRLCDYYRRVGLGGARRHNGFFAFTGLKHRPAIFHGAGAVFCRVW